MENRNKKFITHLILWSGFIGLIFLLLDLHSGRAKSFLITRFMVGLGLFYVNYIILVPKLLFSNKPRIYILIGIIIIIISILIPVIGKVDIIKFFQKGKFIYSIFLNLFFFSAGTAFRIYEKWIENEKREQKIISEKFANELHYLKNQINPHFLFNSLNSIYALTVKKSDAAPEAIITLSELMRYMLYEADNKFVALNSEIEYINNYIKLQKMRFANSDKINISINGNTDNKKISPLILISFIENAFKFGTDNDGNIAIDISLEVNDYELYFICKNTKTNTKDTSKKSGIGIKNTKEQLALLYPNKHQLTITESISLFSVELKINIS